MPYQTQTQTIFIQDEMFFFELKIHYPLYTMDSQQVPKLKLKLQLKKKDVLSDALPEQEPEQEPSLSPTRVKPILKWVGGKTQLLDTIIPLIPKKINNYYEPFIGGCSVLLAVLQEPTIKINGKINAYDVNNSLISLYKNIQTSPSQLYNELQTYISKFNGNGSVTRFT